MGMDQYTGPAWRDDTVSYKKNKKIFILFYSRYNMPCATSFLKNLLERSHLHWPQTAYLPDGEAYLIIEGYLPGRGYFIAL